MSPLFLKIEELGSYFCSSCFFLSSLAAILPPKLLKSFFPKPSPFPCLGANGLPAVMRFAFLMKSESSSSS